jgi:hypothetical protein
VHLLTHAEYLPLPSLEVRRPLASPSGTVDEPFLLENTFCRMPHTYLKWLRPDQLCSYMGEAIALLSFIGTDGELRDLRTTQVNTRTNKMQITRPNRRVASSRCSAASEDAVSRFSLSYLPAAGLLGYCDRLDASNAVAGTGEDRKPCNVSDMYT